MTKPIIVGTDFSEKEPPVLEEGRRLARALGCHVVLVHVVEPIEKDSSDTEVEDFHDSLMAKAEEKMAAIRENWPGDVDLCTLIELGPRVEVLVRLVRERDARMLVLGTPWRDLRGPQSLGVGLPLLVLCPCPVVVVPVPGRTLEEEKHVQ
jgi:nucleotide-binding universal stress UspA family protein